MATRNFSQLTDAGKRMRIASDVIAQLDAEKIIAKNRTYLKMTFGEDVVKKIVMEEMTFDELMDGARDSLGDHLKEMSVAKAIDSAETCEACAMGALFTCAVRMKNGLSVEDADGDVEVDSWENAVEINVERDAMDSRLEDYFDLDQLRLIETAFECSSFMEHDDEDDSDIDDGGEEWSEEKLAWVPKDPKKYAKAHAAVDKAREEREKLTQAAIKFGNRYKRADNRMRAIMQNIVDHRGAFVP